MGLDIYFYKTKISPDYSDDWEEIRKEELRTAKERVAEKYDDVVKKLEKVVKDTPEKYKEKAVKYIKELGKLMSYPGFELREIGCDEKLVGKKWELFIEPKELDVIKKCRDDIVEQSYNPHCAYFRKVNFIYAFFSHKLVEETTWVTLDDVNTLINKCQQVLDNKFDEDFARETLPTMDGFFFGSTEYDKWYYEDVKDCMKEMKKLRKFLEQGYNIYVHMSW